MIKKTKLEDSQTSKSIPLQIHYEVFGRDGDNRLPLILLHGWSNSIEVIQPFAESLGNFFNVYAIDLPGHGKSESPVEVWEMKDFADSLKYFLDQQGITEAYMVGHSFGGKTLIKFSALYPEYIKKLILIGSSGIRPKPSPMKRLRNWFLSMLRNCIRFKNTRLGMRIYNDWYIPTFASRDYKNAGALTKTFVRTLNEELVVEIKKIKIPTLLIWGSEDDESPPSIGKTMNSWISDSNYIEIEGKDHYPFLGSGTSLVTKYVRDFIGN